MRLLTFMVAMFLLTSCGKKPEEPPAPGPTVPNKEFIAALFRGTVNAEKICIASANGAFLFYYPKDRIEEVEGWFLVEKVEFQILPNGTLIFAEIAEHRLKQVHPSVEGLECGTEQEFRK